MDKHNLGQIKPILMYLDTTIIELCKHHTDVFLNQQIYTPAELIFTESVFKHQCGVNYAPNRRSKDTP